MEAKAKLAVTSAIQVGGNLFTAEQLAIIGTVAGTDAKIEMTTFRQLYVEVPLDRHDAIKEELERSGLEVYPAGFVTKSLIACNFAEGRKRRGWKPHEA